MLLSASHIAWGILLTGAPLVTFEYLSRTTKIKPETSRKAVHVLSSLAVVAMTGFCTLTEVASISVLFIVILSLTRVKRIWRSMYRISRQSYGELMFPLGIFAAAVAAADRKTFIAAVLILGFADTVAHLVGTHYGKRQWFVRKPKTYLGSFAFFLCSCLILLALQGFTSLPLIVLVAGASMISELLCAQGTDNAIIPLVTVVFMRLFT